MISRRTQVTTNIVTQHYSTNLTQLITPRPSHLSGEADVYALWISSYPVLDAHYWARTQHHQLAEVIILLKAQLRRTFFQSSPNSKAKKTEDLTLKQSIKKEIFFISLRQQPHLRAFDSLGWNLCVTQENKYTFYLRNESDLIFEKKN